ncbi:MAG: superoxide dismutase family protein [Parachlamydiaceae bacterium]
MMRKWLLSFLLISLCSCDHYKEKKSEIKQAYAEIHSLEGNQVSGTVTFTALGGGVRVVANIEGLSPGPHGFHIHEFGICEDDFSSAGSHFNPGKEPHASPDSSRRHVGDFGNIIADQTGRAHYDRLDTHLKLEGEYSIIGKSVIVHLDEDDLRSQPTGHSGVRVGCGVIKAKTSPTVPNTQN